MYQECERQITVGRWWSTRRGCRSSRSPRYRARAPLAWVLLRPRRSTLVLALHSRHYATMKSSHSILRPSPLSDLPCSSISVSLLFRYVERLLHQAGKIAISPAEKVSGFGSSSAMGHHEHLKVHHDAPVGPTISILISQQPKRNGGCMFQMPTRMGCREWPTSSTQVCSVVLAGGVPGENSVLT